MIASQNISVNNIEQVVSLIASAVPDVIKGQLVPDSYFLVSQTVKNLPATQETCVGSLSPKEPLEKETATHSNILP